MQSLRSKLYEMSKALGVTEFSLFERQRQAVRAGAIESRPGRGPNTGPVASSENIAFLLVASLAGGSSDAWVESAEFFLGLKTEHSEKAFGEWICDLLGSGSVGPKVKKITIFRDSAAAEIQCIYGAAENVWKFGVVPSQPGSGIFVSASIGGDCFDAIRELVSR